jgi:1,2-phenylacetyl-CoA epoxidase PaaB subunit
MKGQTAFTEREIWVGAHKKHPTFIRMPDENEGV